MLTDQGPKAIVDDGGTTAVLDSTILDRIVK